MKTDDPGDVSPWILPIRFVQNAEEKEFEQQPALIFTNPKHRRASTASSITLSRSLLQGRNEITMERSFRQFTGDIADGSGGHRVGVFPAVAAMGGLKILFEDDAG